MSGRSQSCARKPGLTFRIADSGDEGLLTLRQWVALRPEGPRARRKAEPGWPPGEHLQRRARPFWPQPFGKARRQGPLGVAPLARTSVRAACCVLIGPWQRAFATHCRSVNRPWSAQTYNRTVRPPTARPQRVAHSVGVTLTDSEMPPRQRFQQLTAAVLVAVAGLTACRKEVPPPPRPDEVPRPKAAASSAYALPTAYARFGR